jgi:hypothetical protein
MSNADRVALVAKRLYGGALVNVKDEEGINEEVDEPGSKSMVTHCK